VAVRLECTNVAVRLECTNVAVRLECRVPSVCLCNKKPRLRMRLFYAQDERYGAVPRSDVPAMRRRLLGNCSMHCSTTYIPVGIAGDLLVSARLVGPAYYIHHQPRCVHATKARDRCSSPGLAAFLVY
jgi:hypothetical protein